MFKKSLTEIFKILVIGGFLFAGCKKDQQINPPMTKPSVTPPAPVEIINSIYPNPCNGTFTINTNTSTTQTVTITDMTGKTELKLPINGTTAIVDNSLINGIYIVRIENTSGTTLKKLIVEH